MLTPRRRRLLATGAFFFSASLLIGPGCSLVGKSGRKKAPAPAAILVAPRHVEIGRILSYDPADSTAVVEFVPQFRPTATLAGTRLISRKIDTLEPTARLIAAPYQNGRALGAYVDSGRPGVDDEVVIDPTPAAPAPTTAP